MISMLLKSFAVLTWCAFCFCTCLTIHAQSATTGSAKVTVNKPADLQVRNNSLALLFELLEDEKNLSKVLIIKRESPGFKRLIQDISEIAGKGAKLVKSVAKNNAGLDLENNNLPPGEQATRKAIANSKQALLLHSQDAEFEFQLLLMQAEALNYGANLAMVAATNEPRKDYSLELSSLSTQLKTLHQQVIASLRSRPQGTNGP